MSDLKKNFGQSLKEKRKSQKYTQEALAEMIDLSTRQLIRIENGENFPSASTIEKISSVLNIGIENLFNFNSIKDIYITNLENIDNQELGKTALETDLYNYIIKELKKISSNINKLNYIKLAIDSLEDRKSLDEMKIIIKGMELLL